MSFGDINGGIGAGLGGGGGGLGSGHAIEDEGTIVTTAGTVDYVGEGVKSSVVGADIRVGIGMTEFQNAVNTKINGADADSATGANQILKFAGTAIGSIVFASGKTTVTINSGETAIQGLDSLEGPVNTTFGSPGDAAGDFSVSLGVNSSTAVGSTGGVAVGNDSAVSGFGGIAIGSFATATTGAVAVGETAGGGAASATALGDSTTANFVNAVALGNGATAPAANTCRILTGFTFDDANTRLGIGSVPTVTAEFVGTDAMLIPTGTTVQEPAAGTFGRIRADSDTSTIKFDDGVNWVNINAADAVTSVFGRTGAVVAVSGDYTASEITNVPAGNIASVTVQAALNEMDVTTTQGDIAFRGISDWKRLARGSTGQVLTSTASTINWATPASGGETRIGGGANSIEGPTTSASPANADGAADVVLGNASGATNIGAGANTGRVVIGSDADVVEDGANFDTSNSIAIGTNALSSALTAAATGNVVIGAGASVTDAKECVAIGGDEVAGAVDSASCTGDSSVAIGAATAVVNAVAISGGALGEASVAIRGTATGQRGVALGQGATAAKEAVAVGADDTNDDTLATGLRSIAIGNEVDALAIDSTAIGRGSQIPANSSGSVVLGSSAIITNSNAGSTSLIVLSSGDVTGTNSALTAMAIGGNAEIAATTATCRGSIAIGSGSLVTDADEAIAIGGVLSAAAGGGAQVTADNGIAFGTGAIVSAANSICINASGSALTNAIGNTCLISEGLLRKVRVVALAGNVAPTAEETNTHFHGDGTQRTITLPAAAAGLTYCAIVDNAAGLVVTAAAGDTVRSGATVTAGGGSLTSTTVGDVLDLVAIDGTQWINKAAIGGWA